MKTERKEKKEEGMASKSRRNQRKSLDAYDAAFLAHQPMDSDKSIMMMDIFVSSRKAKTPTGGASNRRESKRDKRQTFAAGSAGISSGSSSAPQLISDLQNLHGSPSGLADLPDINVASSLVKKKPGGHTSTRELPTYKLNDILLSENDHKDTPLTVREQRHSDDSKPGRLPVISPIESRKKIETEYEECGGGNGTARTKLSMFSSLTSPIGSGNVTPVPSGKVA